MLTVSALRRLVPLVYESDTLVAVIKPAGVDTGDARDGSTTGLVEWLSALYPDGGRLHAANRLSRYESGLLMLGTSKTEADRVRAELQRGRIELDYVAIVRGQMPKKTLTLGGPPPKPKEKVAHRTARRKPGPVERRPKADRPTYGMTIVSLIEQADQRALVRIQTRLENTHALRALLRGAKLRLLGDTLHDLSKRPGSPQLTCLHLARITRPGPGKKDILMLKAPQHSFGAALHGEFDLERPLHAALVRRFPCLVEPDLDCYRVLSGEAEDVPGLVVERFGEALILQVQSEEPDVADQLRSIARWYMKILDVRAVYVKRFVRDRPRAAEDVADEHSSPKPLVGKPLPEQITVNERGLKFAIRPYDGFSVGLFLDQRENRTRLKEMAAGKDVLNLFAYTCGFSVAAAVGGARRTVSVDVSARNLDRGRENFALNGIDLPAPPFGDSEQPTPDDPQARPIPRREDLPPHTFFRAGAMEYLARAARRSESFDVIVVDPPTFAHGRRGEHRFSVMDDLPELIHRCLAVLRPAGVLLLSTNHRRLSLRGLRDRLRAGSRGRRHEIFATPALPPDFVIDPDFAKSIWVRFA